MAKERSSKNVKCCFSVPLQALLPRPWAGRWRSRLPARGASSPQHERPPRPQSVFTGGGPGGLSVRGDGGDLQCRRARASACPGAGSGLPSILCIWVGRKGVNVGAGGVSAKPRPAHRAALLRPSGPEGGTRLFLPPPSREGCPTPTAAPRSRGGERGRVPLPSPTP